MCIGNNTGVGKRDSERLYSVDRLLLPSSVYLLGTTLVVYIYVCVLSI